MWVRVPLPRQERVGRINMTETELMQRAKTSKPKKTAFTISFEDAQKFEFSDVPISVSEIAKRINAINSSDDMKKLTYKNITDWLVDAEILCVETHQNLRPTPAEK